MDALTIPSTILDAFRLYQISAASPHSKHIAGLKTTFRRYVLPGYRFSYGFTQQAIAEDSEKCLAKVPIEQLIHIEDVFTGQVEAAVEAQSITKDTAKDYRSHLLRFVKWTREQDWYAMASNPNDIDWMPRIKTGRSLKADRQGKRSYNRQPYSLKETELTPKLERQLETKPYLLKQDDFSSVLLDKFQGKLLETLPHYGFHYFCVAPEIAKRQDKAMREVTFEIYKDLILCFLGWLHKIRGWDVETLCITFMADKDLMEEFVAWGISERGNSYTWAARATECSVNVAKWLYHKTSKKRNYRDSEQIEELKDYRAEIHKKRQSDPPRLPLEEKLVTFEECERVVQLLRQCCSTRRFKKSKYTGKLNKAEKRSDTTIMRWWQRYLIIAILTYCPVRQREIRELEIGRTIFREDDGYWVRLKPEDHKTGSKTGKGREYWLPPSLTKDLDQWIHEWRPKANLAHNFVFFSVGDNRHPESAGKPLTSSVLTSMVRNFMYKFTGKRTTPHTFRNIAITFQRQHGRPEQQEALAELMGHSVEVANEVYDQTTSRVKTLKAMDWWKLSE